MTELDQAIAKAYASEGKQEDVNKVHLALLRSHLFIPIQKTPPTEEEPFRPLFAKIEEHYFMVAFDTLERLTHWANQYHDEMDYVTLLGSELIIGMNEGVFLGLNSGTPYYKEFSADEIQHLKKVCARIQALRE